MCLWKREVVSLTRGKDVCRKERESSPRQNKRCVLLSGTNGGKTRIHKAAPVPRTQQPSVCLTEQQASAAVSYLAPVAYDFPALQAPPHLVIDVVPASDPELRPNSGRGAAQTIQEDEPVLVEGNDDARYVVVFDPLDGSSNIDASIPTGKCSRAPPPLRFVSFRVAVRTPPPLLCFVSRRDPHTTQAPRADYPKPIHCWSFACIWWA